jgi:hypothetical protein
VPVAVFSWNVLVLGPVTLSVALFARLAGTAEPEELGLKGGRNPTVGGSLHEISLRLFALPQGVSMEARPRKNELWRLTMYIDVVFDGPPGPEPPRFIEVEDEQGRSI